MRLESYKPLKSRKGTDIVAYRGFVRSGKGSPRVFNRVDRRRETSSHIKSIGFLDDRRVAYQK